MTPKDPEPHPASTPPTPRQRLLRGYAFDPSLSGNLDTTSISQILYAIPWEPLQNGIIGEYEVEHRRRIGAWDPLQKGIIGEYLEVVDYDPPSGCFYAPVDLNHPLVLAQNGLAPSEGNPQFHQQMVYAVAMTTINRFERALGRKAMWAERWDKSKPKSKPGSFDDEFVQRLRIYPHAMREDNAYYSRNKASLLFGYFPAVPNPGNRELPGGMVFTCLSHDIIAHETTHALLDGFHQHFFKATNPDVLAFHEAFADIVALFQHFSFPDQLRHQIAKTRGDLSSENLLAQLATQFGHASGGHGALRDFIGKYDQDGVWRRHIPDPTELSRTMRVHDRGAILVAAVFDAFLAIYKRRTSDLIRLASDGTGILRQGELHPDLVNRLAEECSKIAGQILDMTIRALDYCPPVDLTFGEYLRALITADIDLTPDDKHGYRIAFIESFRRRGIYPGNVRTLSEESLRWSHPEEDPSFNPEDMKKQVKTFIKDVGLRRHVDSLRYLKTRREIFSKTRSFQAELHDAIEGAIFETSLLQTMTGLALNPKNLPPGVKVRSSGSKPVFSVKAFREARRQRKDGTMLNQVFLTLLQKESVEIDGEVRRIHCGSTLVIDLDEATVSYSIRKGVGDRGRIERLREELRSEHSAAVTNPYFRSPETFAALHRH